MSIPTISSHQVNANQSENDKPQIVNSLEEKNLCPRSPIQKIKKASKKIMPEEWGIKKNHTNSKQYRQKIKIERKYLKESEISLANTSNFEKALKPLDKNIIDLLKILADNEKY